MPVKLFFKPKNKQFEKANKLSLPLRDFKMKKN
jgi:hypothetical protein